MTKLLVTSGWPYKTSVEILNLDENTQNLICDNLPELPTGVYLATGQLFGETPIICGGIASNCTCQLFQNGKWKFTTESRDCRYQLAASAILTNSDGKDMFFVAGGFSNNALRTAETFDGTVWNFLENLPLPSLGGCIVQLNSSTIFYIGGIYYNSMKEEYYPPNTTFFYNILVDKWTLGPPVNIGRQALSCGILKWKNPESNQMEKVVVAAGGMKIKIYEGLGSVELLYLNDDNSVKGEWMMGPELPDTATSSKMIEYNNSVILIGGYDRYGRNQPLYQLSSPKGPWIAMKQILKEIRLDPVPFLVPDEVVNCHH